MFKINCPAFSHFWSKSDHSFFDWCKNINIFQEQFFPRKYDKNMGFLTKNLKGWTVKPETFHEDKTDQS